MTSTVLMFALVLQPGRLSVGMECRDRDCWELAPAVARVKDLGVRRARLQSGWAKTEKTKGVYDWAWLDADVGALAGAGVEPWISLSFGNPLYAVEGEGGKALGLNINPLHSPEGLAAWKRYVRAAVGRYRDRVRVWEVWNEPDCSIFWPIRQGSSWQEEYVELVKVTSAEIRAADPTAQVAIDTAAGFASFDSSIGRLFELGVGDHCDIFAFHGYREIPEEFSKDWEDAFYGVIRRRAPKIRFWRGEAGVPSEQPEGGRGALWWVKVDEDVQARWLARHVVRDLADVNLDVTSYFHLYDFVHFTRKYRYHYGVLREDYTAKPSYAVLQRIAALFDDGETVPDRTCLMSVAGEKVTVHSFRRKGSPFFAYVRPLPLAETPAPADVVANTMFGDTKGAWRDPVVVDVVDGSVRRAEVKSARQLTLPVSAHLCVVTENAVLPKPYALEPKQDATARETAEGQVDHE